MTHKSAIYSPVAIGDTGGVPKFNPSSFPAHSPSVETIYINGDYPLIEEVCKEAGIEVKPFSEFNKPTKKGKNHG